MNTESGTYFNTRSETRPEIDTDKTLEEIETASYGLLLAIAQEWYGNIRMGWVSSEDWAKVMIALGDKLPFNLAREEQLVKATKEFLGGLDAKTIPSKD